MTYQDENNQLLKTYLDDSFFRAWGQREPELENFTKLELMFNPECNLRCKYCYLVKHGDELYPREIRDINNQLDNLRMLLDYLTVNGYTPAFEVFSGEPLIQPDKLAAVRMIIDAYRNSEQKPNITIPTNFTFIEDDAKADRVKDIVQYGDEHGVKIFLSASFDGKMIESNRPGTFVRSDEHYDKCFSFAKDMGFGFHPMVYSEGIERWPENFLWYQEKLKEFDIPWWNIYLLEVRDKEWTGRQIESYGNFIRFLMNWTFDKLNHDRELMVRFILEKGFNMLKSPFVTIGRGLGCSIQSTVFVRMGDLSIVPCHRTSYQPFIYGQFKAERGKITGVKAGNVSMMNTVYSFNARNQPYCERCELEPICSFGCLGSQYETNGDMFTPIPTVCAMYRQKYESLKASLRELGIVDRICSMINDRKARLFMKEEG